MTHPDACTSVPLSSLRPGALFSTVAGGRGVKRNTAITGGSLCVSYAAGGEDWLSGDTPCWEIRLGGWPPANALPRVQQGRADATFGITHIGEPITEAERRKG